MGLLGIIFVVVPPINFVSSLVIAACLTPTDPIISAAIVGMYEHRAWRIYAADHASGGKFATKHVPLNLRRILSAESAANDGLAYPFLSISIYLTVERSRGVAFEEWFLVGWLCKCVAVSVVDFTDSPTDEVVLGTLIGAVLGMYILSYMRPHDTRLTSTQVWHSRN